MVVEVRRKTFSKETWMKKKRRKKKMKKTPRLKVQSAVAKKGIHRNKTIMLATEAKSHYKLKMKKRKMRMRRMMNQIQEPSSHRTLFKVVKDSQGRIQT